MRMVPQSVCGFLTIPTVEEEKMRTKWVLSALALALGVWAIGSLGKAAEPAAGPSPGSATTAASTKAKLHVGTFDSRAVAIAWARSEAFDRQLKQRIREYKQAEAASDRETVEKLKAEGRAGQDQLHLQGFGGASVASILKKVKEQIPALAEEAGVGVIVSKWDVVYQSPGVEFVDVTALMVGLFQPNAKAQPINLKDLEKTPLVPLEELEKHKDY
jgi:hypothetical protein